jgi:hypothetical protein
MGPAGSGGGSIQGLTSLNGNIGIGTTTPVNKLDVNGAIRTNNDIIFGFSDGTIRSSSEFVHKNDDGGIDVSEVITDSLYINTLTYRIGGYQDTDTAIRISDNEILYNDESYSRE